MDITKLKFNISAVDVVISVLNDLEIEDDNSDYALGFNDAIKGIKQAMENIKDGIRN